MKNFYRVNWKSMVLSLFLIFPLFLLSQESKAFEENTNNQGNGDEVLISLQMSKQPIESFVSMFSKVSNTTILLGKGVENRQVSAFFQNTPFSVALKSFASAQELCVVERDHCITLVTRKEYMNSYAETQIVPLKNANANALKEIIVGKSRMDSLLEVLVDQRKRRLVLRGFPEQIFKSKKIIEELDNSLAGEVYSIKFASVQNIGELIKEALEISEKSLGSVIIDERSNRLIVYETPENHLVCEKIIKYLDISVDTRVFSTGKIDPAIIAEQIRKGELGDGNKDGKGKKSNSETNVLVIGGTNQIIVTDTPERLEILAKVMKELNQNIETSIIRPKYAMPSELSGILSGSFPDALISVDTRTNSLVITAHQEQVESIRNIVETLDAEANVEVDIEAKIMLVSTKKLKEYGTRIFAQDLDGFNETFLNLTTNSNFLADGVKSEGSTLGSAPGSSLESPLKTSGNYLEALQPNFSINALVHALESDGDTQVLSNPKMRTLVGKTASIFSGSKEPYKEVSLHTP